MTIDPADTHGRPNLDRRPASELLREFGTTTSDELVSVGDILHAFGERGFGLVILLLALINTVPVPPGISSLVGIPLLFLAVQMVIGHSEPRLPALIRNREYRRSDLLRLLDRAQPILRRIEKICRPRFEALFGVLTPRVLGVLICVLAVCVMIPLPFTNSLPSFAAVILAVAIIGADGLLLLVGIAAGLGAITATFLITGAAIGVAILGLEALFGA